MFYANQLSADGHVKLAQKIALETFQANATTGTRHATKRARHYATGIALAARIQDRNASTVWATKTPTLRAIRNAGRTSNIIMWAFIAMAQVRY